jgi:hypothetical protein
LHRACWGWIITRCAKDWKRPASNTWTERDDYAQCCLQQRIGLFGNDLPDAQGI